MADLEATSKVGEQVRVQLTTHDTQVELPESTGPILVPTNLRRYALSTLVNTLRATAGTPEQQPFSFLINGQFLTTSLSDYLTEHGVSAETTLEIEYVRATLPPQPQGSFSHDDWVEAVDVLSGSSAASNAQSGQGVDPGSERILSGSDDGIIRVWNMSGECITTSTRDYDHPKALSLIRAAKFTSTNTIVSAGWDMRIRHWNMASNQLLPTLDMFGHTAPIHSVAVHHHGQQLLSSSADNTAMLWSYATSSPNSPPANPTLLSQLSHTAPSAKRRKLGGSRGPSINIPTRGPIAKLTHTGAVNGAIFTPQDPSVAYTASLDRTIRTWDLTTSKEVSSRTPLPHTPLLSLCALPELNLVATGGTTSIALVDPRENAVNSASMICRGHRNAVVSLAPAPAGRNGHEFVSASHDGTVALWDVRNTRQSKLGESDGPAAGSRTVGEPVWKMPRRERKGEKTATKKVFDVAWDRDVGIVSGGEDCQVQIDKA